MVETQWIENPDYMTPENVADLCCNVTGKKGHKNTKGGFKVCCPVHNDKTPSLDINPGDKGTVINCKAGCTPDEIMVAIGKTTANLFFFRKPDSQPAKHASLLRTIKNSNNSVDSVHSVNSVYSVTNPILKEIPQCALPHNDKLKEHERTLLNLIRFLALDKGLRKGELIPEKAHEIIKEWHNEFFNSESIMHTKELAAGMWKSVKTSIESGIVNEVLIMSKKKTPKTCPKEYRDTEYELFFAVCYYLAEKQIDGIFYLSGETISNALQLTSNPDNRMKASRMFKTLISDGVLIKRNEFKESGFKANRYQLNPNYSSDPSRKNKITVRAWHRYKPHQIINKNPSAAWKRKVEEIKKTHSRTFNTMEFCKRGEAASWKTDYGRALSQYGDDLETAVLSYSASLPQDTPEEIQEVKEL